MYATLVLLFAFVATALADGYAPKVPDDLITHSGLDKHHCSNSEDCHFDEICERVCFWREFTKEFVGCKVTCVKKEPEVVEGYRTILPLDVVKPEPVYKPHPSPAYPEPVYAPAAVPPTAFSEHKQACQFTKECGFGMHCNYAKVCACNKGLVPDPLYSDRCIDLHPKQQVVYSLPRYPVPSYAPKPVHSYSPTCTSTYDCDHGKKCCFWRKCDTYGACTESRQCANEC
uniref:Uncharacterized protein n=1 Tax=Plectus sambesii TaxID=2011161 RepID=A0A914XPR9_9BILA